MTFWKWWDKATPAERRKLLDTVFPNEPSAYKDDWQNRTIAQLNKPYGLGHTEVQKLNEAYEATK